MTTVDASPPSPWRPIMNEKECRRYAQSPGVRARVLAAADAYFEAVAEQTRLELKIERLSIRKRDASRLVREAGRRLQFAAIGQPVPEESS